MLDEDYTISANEFILHPGDVDRYDLGDPEGKRDRTTEIRLIYEVPNYRLRIIVGRLSRWKRKTFTCSFSQTTMDLKSEIVVSMGLTVKGVDYMYKRMKFRHL